MRNLDLLKYKFDNTYSLSDKAIEYIDNLTFKEEISVFLEKPEGPSNDNVGWALLEEREVYIRSTDKNEDYEIRLIHELTHMSLNDEGYHSLSCCECDTLCADFANLLHHFIIYYRMRKFGFSMEQDSILVLDNIENKLRSLHDLCIGNCNDNFANSIILVTNNLLRLTQYSRNEYILKCKSCIPAILDKAIKIEDMTLKFGNTMDIAWYKSCKKIIEKELAIDKFNYLEEYPMNAVILSGTPKEEGLSASCVAAAAVGAEKAGATVEIIELCKTGIDRCKVCGDGWGTCREHHVCAYGSDGFDEVSKKISEADVLIIQTPVYWGEMSEVLKSFIDRFRRCEALQKDTAISGKEVLLIATPGGSGGGLLTCLGQMERAVQHMRGHVFDYIGVNRWNKEYKLLAIEAATEALCKK